MRRTKSPRQAVERVLAEFPEVNRPELPKKPVRELAFVLDLLKRAHADRNTGPGAGAVVRTYPGQRVGRLGGGGAGVGADQP